MTGLAYELSKIGPAIYTYSPGIDVQPRPDSFAKIDDLVLAYLVLIEKPSLRSDVVVGTLQRALLSPCRIDAKGAQSIADEPLHLRAVSIAGTTSR